MGFGLACAFPTARFSVASELVPDTTFIYTLSDPRTGQIRYVGKSDKPQTRFRSHINEQRLNCHRTKWIKSLLRCGLEPKMEILDEVPLAQWQFWEREYIRVFKMLGINLVNNTIGGEGMTDPPPEVREKIARAQRGRIWNEERRAKIMASWTPERRRRNAEKGIGKRHSPQTRAKLSAALAGKKRGPLSEEHKKVLSVLRLSKGFKHTTEAKAKMSSLAKGNKHHLGKKHSDEVRAKMSKTHSSQRLSPSHRANIGLALKGKKRPPEVAIKRLATIRQRKQTASKQLVLNL